MKEILILAIEIMTFATVILAVMAAYRQNTTAASIKKRLDSDTKPRTNGTSSIFKSFDVKNPFLKWIQASTLDNDLKEKSTLQRKLVLAGYSHPAAPAIFVTLRLVAASGLPLMFILLQSFSVHPMVGTQATLLAVGLSALGLIGPGVVLDGRVAARREAIETQFPDALDLMVVCVEAGLGLEGAILRVGQETSVSHPIISRELKSVSLEMGAGRSRPEALRGLAERTDMESIRSFVALLIQTDQLGVSYAKTLRTFSAELREKRYMSAEEKAMRIPLLITIPLVMCILPALIIAALLPAMIEAQQGFATMLAAGHPK